MAEVIDLVSTDESDNDATENLEVATDPNSACQTVLLTLFPEICPLYAARVAADHGDDPDRAVEFVLDSVQQGNAYEKAAKAIKRKRLSGSPPDDQDKMANVVAMYTEGVSRQKSQAPVYLDFAKKLLAQDFPWMRVEDIRTVLQEKNGSLMSAYVSLKEEARLPRLHGDAAPRFRRKKTATTPEARYLQNNIDLAIRLQDDATRKAVLQELKAAREVSADQDAKREYELQMKRDEEENFSQAKRDGATTECGCCFGDYALNRMVTCNGNEPHFFCVECTRKNAESVIGATQYELKCISMDGCAGGFSISQRRLFLDDKLTAALDRIEVEAVLRMADLQNLAKCPFCNFAAEYPPVEEDKEFRCGHETCLIVSCRLCNKETHIPRSCEEAARDQGLSARQHIEEAMSAALIRKCNKCQTPFIKESGCNKMACTRAGCGNIQCYVCSQSCGYDHFNEVARGGKIGNCPLFENAEVRHDDEVLGAERAARQKVIEEHPEIDEEHLRITMSDRVAKDDARRREINPYPHAVQPRPVLPPAPAPPPNPQIAMGGVLNQGAGLVAPVHGAQIYQQRLLRLNRQRAADMTADAQREGLRWGDEVVIRRIEQARARAEMLARELRVNEWQPDPARREQIEPPAAEVPVPADEALRRAAAVRAEVIRMGPQRLPRRRIEPVAVPNMIPQGFPGSGPVAMPVGRALVAMQAQGQGLANHGMGPVGAHPVVPSPAPLPPVDFVAPLFPPLQVGGLFPIAPLQWPQQGAGPPPIGALVGDPRGDRSRRRRQGRADNT